MTKILKFLQVSLLIFGLFLVLLPASNRVAVSAQGVVSKEPVSQACTDIKFKKKIKFADIIYIGNFLPLIPEECGVKDGNVNPLPIYLLFDILIRTIGFLFSFAFYMLPVAIIIYGTRILFLPFDPSLNKNEFQEVTTAGRTITRDLSSFVIGLIIIVFSYTIVFTILGTLQIESNTDLSSFFELPGQPK
jgi:hypothetical protein